MAEVFKCAHNGTKKVSDLLLIQNPKNNNKHSKEQIDRLAKIIAFQGQRAPIVISKRSGFIVKGHGRLFALDKLGWENAAVDYQDYKTEAEEYADMTADNEIARWAEFDEAKFLDDIKDLDLGDFDLLGLKKLPDLLAEEKVFNTDEDAVPDVDQNIHGVKLGQIYKLGDHRLMCGDSTSIDAVEKLMNGEKADMVFTDPPYGIKYDDGIWKNRSKQRESLKNNNFGMIKNDEVSVSHFVDFIIPYFKSTPRVFIWGILNGKPNPLLEGGSYIVWDKKTEAQANCPYGDFDICWSKNVGWKTLRHMWGGFHSKEKGEKRLHPTQKPISLILDFFTRWGDKCFSVVDLFGGSGSTLIACEKTNRKCFMMELDPHYCSVIIERWQQFTGKKAELLNG